MKFSSFIGFTFLLCVFSCSETKNDDHSSKKGSGDSLNGIVRITDCRQLFERARKMDSILYTQIEVDQESANKAIKAFTEFVDECQSDSLAPVFLIKTAQVARAINNIPKAKLVLDKCIEDYPTFKNRPAALFLLAQLYDDPTYLNNEAEAKTMYQKIIDEYPKSEWASSAKGAIKFIGKSDEQIMQELKSK